MNTLVILQGLGGTCAPRRKYGRL